MTDVTVSPTGVTATGATVTVFVWLETDDAQTPSWSEVSDNQTPSWSEVSTTQDPAWVTAT
jgi:hypothetical protein